MPKLCQVHVLLCFLLGRSAATASFQVDGRQELRSLGPILLCLEDLAQQLPDDKVFLFKGHYTAPELLKGVEAKFLDFEILELLHLLGHLKWLIMEAYFRFFLPR